MAILAPSYSPARTSGPGRLTSALLAAGSLAVLLVALWLRPNPRGLGTHVQLHMDACQFECQTGIACPTCGMTTSFALFVRGRWIGAFGAQPFGCLLALVTTMTLWCAGYIAVSGKPVHRLLRLVPSRYYLWVPLGLAIFGWAWKIVAGARA